MSLHLRILEWESDINTCFSNWNDSTVYKMNLLNCGMVYVYELFGEMWNKSDPISVLFIVSIYQICI